MSCESSSLPWFAWLVLILLLHRNSYKHGKELAANITVGAIANVGALRVNESAREAKPDLAVTDVVWMMARNLAEANKTNVEEIFPDDDDKRIAGHRQYF